MSAGALLELARAEPAALDAIGPRLTPYIPHRPTPKQAAFLLLQDREAFMGGGGGSGKSDALLAGALQYVDVPGYAALILRRTYQDLALPGALMDRAYEWLGPTDARWNGADHRWTFPSGASLTFGYLETERDRFRYASAEFAYVAFDELAAFPETYYRFLFSRLRRLAGSEVPLRVRAASNPGGPYAEWVRQRFLEEREPGRAYIPATLEENPHLDREQYVRSLERLDPITRRQLLEGDWSAREQGDMFRREWFKVVDRPPPGLRLVRFWDLAATEAKRGRDPDYTAGCLLGRDRSGHYYVCDVRRTRSTPGAVEALVRQTAELDGRSVPVRIEQEPGASGVSLIDRYVREVLPGFNVRGVRPSGDKTTRAAPFSSMAEAGNVSIVRGQWVGVWLDELEAFPLSGAHDDAVDAVVGAFDALARSKRARIRRLL